MSTAVAINIIYKTSSVHHVCRVTTAHLLHASAWMVYHHLNNCILKCFNSMKIINNFFLKHSIWQKRKSPLVRVEPNASHLPDKHPRPLDHRRFPICNRSLIQVIHICPLLWQSILFTRHHLCIMSAELPLHICSMHLPGWSTII